MCVEKPEMTGDCQGCGEKATAGIHGRKYCEAHFIEEWTSIGKLMAAFGGMYEGEVHQVEIAPVKVIGTSK